MFVLVCEPVNVSETERERFVCVCLCVFVCAVANYDSQTRLGVTAKANVEKKNYPE